MFTTKNFTLENGQALPELALAYETHGRLAGDGRNAILITHGFTSNHHAAGPPAEPGGTPGFWDGLIGPGKTIDTDRYYVVSSNMLGSSYGSTAPRSDHPATGHHPARHRHRAEGAARLARRPASGGGGGTVVRRLPGLPVGGDVSRSHERGRAGGDGAQGLGRRAGRADPDRATRQGWAPALREFLSGLPG